MKTVKVIFADSKYNYSTSVSEASTEDSLRRYFVGSRLNMGSYPIEDMQVCTDIELIEDDTHH